MRRRDVGPEGRRRVLRLAAEVTLVLRLRGLTPEPYLAGRDPVAGTVYVGMLGILALLPMIVGVDSRR